MKSTFSITFFLKKKTIYKDSTHPIMGRIRVSGSVSDFRTKLQIHADNWNQKKCRGKGNTPEIENLNAVLSSIERSINVIKNNVLIEKGSVNAVQIKEIYVGLNKTEEEKESEHKKLEEQHKQEEEERARQEIGISLIDYYNNYLESRKDEIPAGQLTQSTYSRYECVRDRLISYMQAKYEINDLPLKQIDIIFVRNFEMYIRTNFKCKNNTVMKLMQKFCTVITLAHDTGIIPLNPFKLYNFYFDGTDRDVLTLEELQTLYNYKFVSKKLERVRDNYVFSCYTGLAYTDTDNLNEQDFKESFDGKEWIIRRREKTNVECKVLLLNIPRQILKKYENKLPEGQLLPIISNQKTNDYLKEIADIIGINKHLTFHTARHTFATTVCLTNGVPLESLQKMLGHSSIKTTQIYAKIVDTKLCEDMNNLAEKLKEKEKTTQQKVLKENFKIIPRKTAI